MGIKEALFGNEENDYNKDEKVVINEDKEYHINDEYNRDSEYLDRDDLTEDEKIKLHEERLRINKDEVESGEITIDKNVITEKQEFDVPVNKDEVTIERRRVDEYVEGDIDFDNLKDEEIRIPLTEERIHVEKENVVTEELVIKKDRVQDVVHVDETVRKEVADIDESHLKNNIHEHDYEEQDFDRRNDRF